MWRFNLFIAVTAFFLGSSEGIRIIGSLRQEKGLNDLRRFVPRVTIPLKAPNSVYGGFQPSGIPVPPRDPSSTGGRVLTSEQPIESKDLVEEFRGMYPRVSSPPSAPLPTGDDAPNSEKPIESHVVIDWFGGMKSKDPFPPGATSAIRDDGQNSKMPTGIHAPVPWFGTMKPRNFVPPSAPSPEGDGVPTPNFYRFGVMKPGDSFPPRAPSTAIGDDGQNPKKPTGIHAPVAWFGTMKPRNFVPPSAPSPEGDGVPTPNFNMFGIMKPVGAFHQNAILPRGVATEDLKHLIPERQSSVLEHESDLKHLIPESSVLEHESP